MGVVKQIEIQNRTHYFYNDMINFENFDSNLLKIDKKYYRGINIYYIGYITIKKIDDCGNIHCVNPVYLLVNHANGYIEEKNGNKYLIFDDSVNENKELLKKYADVWDGIKSKIKAINGGKENNYGKDYMKIKFNSGDDLPLNKPLKFHAVTMIIRSVFKEDGKLYPQVFLDDALYELPGVDIGYSINWRTFHSTDTAICVYKMLQVSAHWVIVIINIEGSIIPSV